VQPGIKNTKQGEKMWCKKLTTKGYKKDKRHRRPFIQCAV